MKRQPELLVSILCLALLSCKKDTQYIVTQDTPLSLSITEVLAHSILNLKWPRYSPSDFKSYRVIRMARVITNGVVQQINQELTTITDPAVTSFTENKMPFARDVYYRVYVERMVSGLPGPASNWVIYTRKKTKVYEASVDDILVNKQNKWVYIIDRNGAIHIIDYLNNEPVKSVQLNTTIGYCSLGSNGGVQNELYVPRDDGWLDILDASTLQVKDRIYVTGLGMSSVVFNNGLLFVSSSDLSLSGFYSQALKVYNRATKGFIANAGYRDRTRLILVPGTNTELFELTEFLGPSDLAYYKFNSLGQLETSKQDSYHGDYAMDRAIFKAFPDGSRMITSTKGSIFNKSLVFEQYVNQFKDHGDFEFNANGTVIYAGVYSQNIIETISYPSMSVTQSFTTRLLPAKIFRDNNELISISVERQPMYTYPATYFVIDKFSL